MDDPHQLRGAPSQLADSLFLTHSLVSSALSKNPTANGPQVSELTARALRYFTTVIFFFVRNVESSLDPQQPAETRALQLQAHCVIPRSSAKHYRDVHCRPRPGPGRKIQRQRRRLPLLFWRWCYQHWLFSRVAQHGGRLGLTHRFHLRK